MTYCNVMLVFRHMLEFITGIKEHLRTVNICKHVTNLCHIIRTHIGYAT